MLRTCVRARTHSHVTSVSGLVPCRIPCRCGIPCRVRAGGRECRDHPLQAVRFDCGDARPAPHVRYACLHASPAHARAWDRRRPTEHGRRAERSGRAAHRHCSAAARRSAAVAGGSRVRAGGREGGPVPSVEECECELAGGREGGPAPAAPGVRRGTPVGTSSTRARSTSTARPTSRARCTSASRRSTCASAPPHPVRRWMGRIRRPTAPAPPRRQPAALQRVYIYIFI